jgi:hypothetical protein
MTLKKFAKATGEEVIEILSSDASNGLSALNIVSLRRVHGLNKLEGEVKVNYYPTLSSSGQFI